MKEEEIYKRLLEIEGKRHVNGLYLDIFMFFCMLVFIGWSITKDISQETEKQKLNAAIIKQQKVIEELNKNNIELRKALKIFWTQLLQEKPKVKRNSLSFILK